MPDKIRSLSRILLLLCKFYYYEVAGISQSFPTDSSALILSETCYRIFARGRSLFSNVTPILRPLSIGPNVLFGVSMIAEYNRTSRGPLHPNCCCPFIATGRGQARRKIVIRGIPNGVCFTLLNGRRIGMTILVGCLI